MCLAEILTHGIFKLLPAIYFQNMCICDMRFLVEKNSALFCFLDGLVIKTSNSVINCIKTVPDCGLPNGTKFSNFMNYC